MSNLRSFIIFILIAAVLFFADSQKNNQSKVMIDTTTLEYLSGNFQREFGRLPNESELMSSLNSWYEDEILYQEALNNNLFIEDEIVRRRLIQKMKYFFENEVLTNINDKDVFNYYLGHKDNFGNEALYSFSHQFFKDESSKDPAPFFLGSDFENFTASQIKNNFGESFLEQMNNMKEADTWITSDFGIHKILNLKIIKSPEKSFEEIKQKVRQAYLEEKKQEFINQKINELKARYPLDILVEKPSYDKN